MSIKVVLQLLLLLQVTVDLTTNIQQRKNFDNYLNKVISKEMHQNPISHESIKENSYLQYNQDQWDKFYLSKDKISELKESYYKNTLSLFFQVIRTSYKSQIQQKITSSDQISRSSLFNDVLKYRFNEDRATYCQGNVNTYLNEETQNITGKLVLMANGLYNLSNEEEQDLNRFMSQKEIHKQEFELKFDLFFKKSFTNQEAQSTQRNNQNIFKKVICFAILIAFTVPLLFKNQSGQQSKQQQYFVTVWFLYSIIFKISNCLTDISQDFYLKVPITIDINNEFQLISEQGIISILKSQEDHSKFTLVKDKYEQIKIFDEQNDLVTYKDKQSNQVFKQFRIREISNQFQIYVSQNNEMWCLQIEDGQLLMTDECNQQNKNTLFNFRVTDFVIMRINYDLKSTQTYNQKQREIINVLVINNQTEQVNYSYKIKLQDSNHYQFLNLPSNYPLYTYQPKYFNQTKIYLSFLPQTVLNQNQELVDHQYTTKIPVDKDRLALYQVQNIFEEVSFDITSELQFYSFPEYVMNIKGTYFGEIFRKSFIEKQTQHQCQDILCFQEYYEIDDVQPIYIEKSQLIPLLLIGFSIILIILIIVYVERKVLSIMKNQQIQEPLLKEQI